MVTSLTKMTEPQAWRAAPTYLWALYAVIAASCISPRVVVDGSGAADVGVRPCLIPSSSSCPVIKDVKTVHVVYMSHLDLGFTAETRSVCSQYFTILFPKALNLTAELRYCAPDRPAGWGAAAELGAGGGTNCPQLDIVLHCLFVTGS